MRLFNKFKSNQKTGEDSTVDDDILGVGDNRRLMVSRKAAEQYKRMEKIAVAAVENVANDDSYSLMLSGYVGGYRFSAELLQEFLENAGGKDVKISIFSVGGSVYEGLACYNLLREYKGNVTTHIVGIAASAATLVALGGSQCLISDSALFMIHNSSCVAWGDAREVEKLASYLKKCDGVVRKIYVSRTRNKDEDIKKWMDEETYFTADEAVEYGFIHDVVGSSNDDDDDDDDDYDVENLGTDLSDLPDNSARFVDWNDDVKVEGLDLLEIDARLAALGENLDRSINLFNGKK